MPRGSSTTVENQFVRGLITEQSAMNFPEQAVTDADNCIFSELGPVRRRLGMDYENEFVGRHVSSITNTPEAKIEFKWYSAGNISTIIFLVQQFGNILTFFSVSSDSSVSVGMKPFTVNLMTFVVPGVTQAQVAAQPCQFSYGKGYLFVTNPLCDPFYVSYDASSDSITTNRITIQVRDFDGVEDGLETDQRPSTLSNAHRYNLYNQGWGTFTQTANNTREQALAYWSSGYGDFPSNADIFWVFRNAEGKMDNETVDRKYQGNTPAPKGHFIYNALDIDRSSMTGIPGLPRETSFSARPTVTAFYAGRVFYAGVGANKYSNRLYFSQILESDRQIGRCYQQNDPTSEITFDLLDSDGGIINLPLIERVVAMKVIDNILVILATNGIITINGSTTGPFRATNYEVNYISTIGSSSSLSIIEVDGGLMFWNNEVIYALVKDQVGTLQVQNVSKSTIQTLLNNIPITNLSFIKGAYNKKDQIIQWIFSDDEDMSGYQYNRILEFNVISKAFYTHTIDGTDGNRMAGIVTILGQGPRFTTETVTDNLLNTTTIISGDPIQVQVTTFVPNSEVFRYLTIGPFGTANQQAFTYSAMADQGYVDWRNITGGTGRTYNSYGVSGYRVRGAFQQGSQSSPVAFVVKYFEDGRLLVSGIWDYGFRESTQQEIYLVRPEVDYLVRRMKIRGKGKSFQIKFQSVGNAPFELLGWSTFDSGGTVP